MPKVYAIDRSACLGSSGVDFGQRANSPDMGKIAEQGYICHAALLGP
jgi:hypothetical protein